MTITIALVAFGVVGATVAALLYALRVISKLQAADVEDRKVFERLIVVEKELGYWKDRAASLAKLVEEKTLELAGETEALHRAEVHRDELLKELLATGNPSAVAKAIQNELAALSGVVK